MKVYISATLRSFFGRTSETETEGKTIRSILKSLTDKYPEAVKGLYDDNGKLRGYIRIYVNDEDKTDESFLDEAIDEN